jgi:hypothetical protein
MSIENPLWGAPRIHGELLKLGFEVAQSSVAKYMVKRRGPPSQGWRTFLQNHAPDIAAMDLFVAPTIGFNLLYAFVIVRLGRRNLVWINVTRKNPPGFHLPPTRQLALGNRAASSPPSDAQHKASLDDNTERGLRAAGGNVRFGSKADMCSALAHVR